MVVRLAQKGLVACKLDSTMQAVVNDGGAQQMAALSLCCFGELLIKRH
jgi:hypothetical protein